MASGNIDSVHLNFTELRIVNMGVISNGTTMLDSGALDSGVSTDL